MVVVSTDGLLALRQWIGMDVRSRTLLLVAIAAVFAALDLAQKLSAEAPLQHARSPEAAILMACVVLALVSLVPRVPSSPAAVGGGIAAGGALGNLVSLGVWSHGIPDTILRGGVALNLADVFALGGDGLLLAATAVYAVRNRHRLRERI